MYDRVYCNRTCADIGSSALVACVSTINLLLFRQLLEVDVTKRLTVEQARSSPWVRPH